MFEKHETFSICLCDNMANDIYFIYLLLSSIYLRNNKSLLSKFSLSRKNTLFYNVIFNKFYVISWVRFSMIICIVTPIIYWSYSNVFNITGECTVRLWLQEFSLQRETNIFSFINCVVVCTQTMYELVWDVHTSNKL